MNNSPQIPVLTEPATYRLFAVITVQRFYASITGMPTVNVGIYFCFEWF